MDCVLVCIFVASERNIDQFFATFQLIPLIESIESRQANYLRFWPSHFLVTPSYRPLTKTREAHIAST